MKLQYCMAGNIFGLQYKNAAKTIIDFESNSDLIGTNEEIAFTSESVQLEVHDKFILYSDGFVQARNPEGKPFSNDTLKEIINSNLELEGRELFSVLVDKQKEFCRDTPPSDDQVLVILDVISIISPEKLSQEKRSKMIEQLIQTGSQHLKNNDLDKAYEAFQKILLYKPDSSVAFSNIGKILVLQKNYEEAHKALLRAVELFAASAQNYYYLGLISFIKEDWQSAVKYLEKSLAIEPGFQKSSFMLKRIKNVMEVGQS